tara:strand:+ start:850 stop:1263 length:414 start_codon:yes stop_codon:yes gene_type:complete
MTESKGIFFELPKDQEELFTAHAKECERIANLSFDKWIEWLEKMNAKRAEANIRNNPLSSEECLNIIRHGWIGDADDQTEAMKKMAEIIYGFSPDSSRQKLIAHQLIFFLRDCYTRTDDTRWGDEMISDLEEIIKLI